MDLVKLLKNSKKINNIMCQYFLKPDIRGLERVLLLAAIQASNRATTDDTTNINEDDNITIISENGNFELNTKFKLDGKIEGFLTSTDYFGRMVTELESSNNPDFSSAVPLLNYKKVKIS